MLGILEGPRVDGSGVLNVADPKHTALELVLHTVTTLPVSSPRFCRIWHPLLVWQCPDHHEHHVPGWSGEAN